MRHLRIILATILLGGAVGQGLAGDSYVQPSTPTGYPQEISAPPSGSWIFQRSYYTHDPVSQVRIGRQHFGGPYYTRPQGDYVRHGYRYNNTPIRVGGSNDNTMVIERWVQWGSQY